MQTSAASQNSVLAYYKENPLNTSITTTVFVALVVIAALGMAGKISAPVMGWTFTGITAGSSLIGLAHLAKYAENNPATKMAAISNIVQTVVYVLLGALTATGFVSATALGWAYFGPIIGVTGLACLGASSCLGILFLQKSGSSADDEG